MFTQLQESKTLLEFHPLLVDASSSMLQQGTLTLISNIYRRKANSADGTMLVILVRDDVLGKFVSIFILVFI